MSKLLAVAEDENSFQVGRCLRDTAALYGRHFAFVLTLSLLYLLPMVTFFSQTYWQQTPINWLLDLCLIPWLAALLWGIDRREKGQAAGPWQSLRRGFQLWPRLLGLQMINAACLLFAAVMFLLPVAYAWVTLCLGPALAVVEDQPADKAFGESYELTQNHFWKLLQFWLALGGLLLLLLIGHIGLGSTLVLSGLADIPTMIGPVPQIVYSMLGYQAVAAAHLAALAALHQLRPTQASAEQVILGFTPESP